VPRRLLRARRRAPLAARAARIVAFHVIESRNQSTCAFAAEGGHLETLKWARKHRCPWDEETCERAAEQGELEVLSWAIEHECPGGERYEHHFT